MQDAIIFSYEQNRLEWSPVFSRGVRGGAFPKRALTRHDVKNQKGLNYMHVS